MTGSQACADTAGRDAGLRPLNFPLRVRARDLLLWVLRDLAALALRG